MCVHCCSYSHHQEDVVARSGKEDLDHNAGIGDIDANAGSNLDLCAVDIIRHEAELLAAASESQAPSAAQQEVCAFVSVRARVRVCVCAC